MQHTGTPKKANDGIEDFKNHLSARYGLIFPPRDPTWSPSKKDPSSIAEKIHQLVRFLHFKGSGESGAESINGPGALDYVLLLIERQMPSIQSRWVFKPRAQPDVLPVRGMNESVLQKDFIRRRQELDQGQQKELMSCVHVKLHQVAECVKKGQSTYLWHEIPLPPSDGEASATRRGSQNSLVDIHPSIEAADKPMTDSKMKKLTTQSRLNMYFPNKTAPPSSVDEYGGAEYDQLLVGVSTQGENTASTTNDRAESVAQTSEQSSEGANSFRTPPTTPPVLQAESSNGNQKAMGPPAAMTKLPKRRLNDTTPQSGPRKVSRSTSRADGLSRSISDSFLNDAPSSSFQSNSTNLSFGAMSSATTNSSTYTSPNTSFSSVYSADSRKTSFDFPSDTDTTIRGWDKLDTDVMPVPVVLTKPAEFDKHPISDSLETNTALNRPPQQGLKVDGSLEDMFEVYTPFRDGLLESYQHLPLRQRYEILRVSLSTKLDLKLFESVIRSEFSDYDRLWASLTSITRSNGSVMPERSNSSAWDRAGARFDGIVLSGKLTVEGQAAKDMLRFVLSPLKLELSHRLARQFGNDRFFVLDVPALERRKLPSEVRDQTENVHNALRNWLASTQHCLLGRRWRAFDLKEIRTKKSSSIKQGKITEHIFKIHFFAEDGYGFSSMGEYDLRGIERPRMTVLELLEWFLPFESNKDQSALKLFARLHLGISKTVATAHFKPHQIFRTDDAYACAPKPRKIDVQQSDTKKQSVPSTSHLDDTPVMNDGCARISKAAARAVADHLGLEQIPSAFQGRICGAKGMWFVDVTNDRPGGLDFWIEISDSQVKFEDGKSTVPRLVSTLIRTEDLVFEVNDWVKRLAPSTLNFPLIPILQHGGVPAQVFMDILQEDLTTQVSNLQAAMTSGLALRLWNQRNNAAERADIMLQRGLPRTTAEKINWFIDHGFEPRSCKFLKDLLQKAISVYCQRLKEKLDVGIGQSAYPFIIADPLAVLEEDEVHLCFSTSFNDPKSGFDKTMVHNRDILVARLPAYLPSDIQKVRAVFKTELSDYRDVIVFSSKGSTSLASKLSGGDYDGDRAWVCWDSKLVDPFRNTDVPVAPSLENFSIHKDTTRASDFITNQKVTAAFISHGFEFNMRLSMLGTCSTYYEALCYSGYRIDDPKAIEVGCLLGLLVDSAKGGFVFDELKWNAYLRSRNLPLLLRKPAYKHPTSAKSKKTSLIDCLVFDVAGPTADKALADIHKQYADAQSQDDDLTRYAKDEDANAKTQLDLKAVLENLRQKLNAIFDFWIRNMRPENEENFGRKARGSTESTEFRSVIEHCRAEFLSLAPDTGDEAIPIKSDRILEWRRQHANQQLSYWDLLKASVAFQKHHLSKFVWHTTGPELGEIKVKAGGRGSYRTVRNDIYKALKVDGKYVEGVKRRDDFEAMVAAVQDAIEDEENDDESYGTWSWEDDIF